MQDSLGDRMKGCYENRNRTYLTRRTPVIIRLDGKSFHTFTKGFEKPFDTRFIEAMKTTAEYLVKNIQCCKLAYVQSDEISLLLTDFDKFTSEAWFDYNVQKLVSISASMASVVFSNQMNRNAFFDSRCFNLPKEEVINYFIWRQKDWIRNSVLMLGQSLFTQKELQNKSQKDIIDMCKEKGKDWFLLGEGFRFGIFIYDTGCFCNDSLNENSLTFNRINKYLDEVEK